MGKLTEDSAGYKMQVMPLWHEASGTVIIGENGNRREVLVELGEGSSITFEDNTGTVSTKEAPSMVQYGIPAEIYSITVDAGPVTIY